MYEVHDMYSNSLRKVSNYQVQKYSLALVEVTR